MPNLQYNRPPITEAVIEIRIEDSISEKTVEKINDKLKRYYEKSDLMSAIGFKIEPNSTREFEKLPNEFVGYKLSSRDQADFVQVRQNLISSSRLAPYKGWDEFAPIVRRNWEIWKREAKHRKLERIGVRFLNRIDIPFKEKNPINVEDYLTIFPKYPEPDLLKNFGKYTMQITGPFYIDGFSLTINSNVVKSPLIDHCSIVLDLDLSPHTKLPEKDDQIWELLNEMRTYKNTAFEMCITDKARELFA